MMYDYLNMKPNGCGNDIMKIQIVVHEDEDGFWAEVPSIPGCVSQGNTFEELLPNLYEAIEGCLSVDISQINRSDNDRLMEIAI